MGEPVIVSERPGGIYTNDVRTSRHHLYADEPLSYGSSDLGPTPYEYLCAALGSCTTITMRMYIERKNWKVDHLSVNVTHHKDKADDGTPRDVFTRRVDIKGDVDDAQRARILEIAGKCPVHKTLAAGSDVITKAA